MDHVILADAIEAWGRRYRRHLDDSALEKLAFVWRTVRTSEVGRRELDQMDKDDARTVMLLFDEDDRNGIAELLNTVRTWAIDNNITGDEPDDPEPPAPTPEPVSVGAPTQIIADDYGDPAADLVVSESESGAVLSSLGSPEPAPVAAPPGPDATPIVVAPYSDMHSAPPPVAAAPSGDPLVGAPPPTLREPTQAQRPAAASRIPQPLPAPLGFEQERAPIPQWMLAAGAGLLLLVLIVIFLLTRGGEDPAVTTGQTETGVSTQVESEQPESIDLGTVTTDGG